MVRRGWDGFWRLKTAKKTYIGTCKVSLLEAFKKHGSATKWPIFKSSENVGFIKLIITFDKKNVTTLKERLCGIIVDKILEDFKMFQDNVIDNLFLTGIISEIPEGYDVPEPFDYNNISDISKSDDVEHFVEISCDNDSGCKTNLELVYNNQIIGTISSMLQKDHLNCPPIKSITKDAIEIRSTTNEQQSTSTSFEEEDPRQRTVLINSIPWKLGRILNVGDIKLHLELRSKFISSSKGQKIELIVIRKLLHVLYFHELNSVSNNLSSREFVDGCDGSLWNGYLGADASNILSILRPYCSSKEWHAMVLWTLLGIRTFFPEIKSKILNFHLKYVVELNKFNYLDGIYGFNVASINDFVVENYRQFCVRKITKCQVSDFQNKRCIEEIKFLIKNLILLNGNDMKEDRTNMITQIGENVREEMLEFTRSDSDLIQCLNRWENWIIGYESTLQAIQDKFGDFAAQTWCPILSLIVIKEALSGTGRILNILQSKETSNKKEQPERIIEVYMQIKSLFKYKEGCNCEAAKKEFFQSFQSCLSQLLHLMGEKARSHIFTAVNQQKQCFIKKAADKTAVYQNPKTNELDILDEIALANDITGILQCIRCAWKQILQPYQREGGICLQFLQTLHELFMFHVDSIKKEILAENEFLLSKYSKIIMALIHVEYKFMDEIYFNEMRVDEMKDFDQENIKRMREVVEQKVNSITDCFCSFQSKNMKVYFEKTNVITEGSIEYQKLNKGITMRGHIKGILTDLHDTIERYSNIGNETSTEKLEESFLGLNTDTNYGKRSLRTKIFQLEEETINLYFEKLENKKKLPLLKRKASTRISKASPISPRHSKLSTDTLSCKPSHHQDDLLSYQEFIDILDQSQSLREEEGLENSAVLTKIYNKLRMKTLTTLQLISKYLELTCEANKNQDENTGLIRYVIGRVGSTLNVCLKNVTVKTREGKDSCNFRIKIALLPIRHNVAKCFISKSTPIHRDKNTVIFDLDDNQPNPNKHNFEFDLEDDTNFREEDNFTQYLEMNLYDMSTNYFSKFFRGHVLVPLTNTIPSFDDIEGFQEHCLFTDHVIQGKFISVKTACRIDHEQLNRTSCLNSALELMHFNFNGVYNELTTREEGFAKHYLKHRDSQYINCKTPTTVKMR